MVCFTDIPIELSEAHRNDYGSYGIGLKKEWGIKNKLNPINYVIKDSILCNNFNNIQRLTYDLINKLIKDISDVIELKDLIKDDNSKQMIALQIFSSILINSPNRTQIQELIYDKTIEHFLNVGTSENKTKYFIETEKLRKMERSKRLEYLENSPEFSKLLHQISDDGLNHILNFELVPLLLPLKEEIQRYAQEIIMDYAGFLKLYSEDTKSDNKPYYDEREWRYLPPYKNKDNTRNRLLPNELTEEKKLKFNEYMCLNYPLKFLPKDIGVIIVEGNKEKEQLITNLQKSKLNNIECYISKVKVINL